MSAYEGKRLLVLGANPETAGLVLRARELGCTTYVTDYNHGAYAKRFADVALDIDASDVEALREVFEAERMDGVVVGVAEALLPSYQRLCDALGIPSYGSAELFALMVDKSAFKTACRRFGVPVVQEYDGSDLSAVPLPVVTKPVDACSSRGISVCRTYDELLDGVEAALAESKEGRIIIERYMTGDEVVIYYAFQDGVASLVGMCDRYTNKEQKGVAQLPTSYVFPSRHLSRYLEETDESVRRMFESLGVRNGTLFIQSFIDEDGGVRFYEPGYRLNGAQEHFVLGSTTGVDARDLYIAFALTGRFGDYDVASRADPYLNGMWGCKLSPLVRGGRIGGISGLESISRLPEVVSVNPSYVVGDTVSGKGTLKQIVCRFFIVSGTRERLEEAVGRVTELFEVEDERGESMLLTPFDATVIGRLYGRSQ